jgi:maleate cis-trans isomerase
VIGWLAGSKAKLYLAGVAAIAWTASLGAASWWAYGVGKDHEMATQYREGEAARKAGEAASVAAAQAVAKLEVQRVEITQPVLREVRDRVVYKDCRHSPEGFKGMNAALTGARQDR